MQIRTFALSALILGGISSAGSHSTLLDCPHSALADSLCSIVNQSKDMDLIPVHVILRIPDSLLDTPINTDPKDSLGGPSGPTARDSARKEFLLAQTHLLFTEFELRSVEDPSKRLETPEIAHVIYGPLLASKADILKMIKEPYILRLQFGENKQPIAIRKLPGYWNNKGKRIWVNVQGRTFEDDIRGGGRIKGYWSDKFPVQ